jgi:phage anti-repressor protein
MICEFCNTKLVTFKYIGYYDIDINSSKRAYIIILKDNFEEENDFKLLNNKEFIDISKCIIMHLENIEINNHNKTKHLIISPDCFKQSLMLLKTKKSKDIRSYYIELEKIFKFYLQYQNLHQKKILEDK